MSIPTLLEAAASAERARLESHAVLTCQRNISGLVLDCHADDLDEAGRKLEAAYAELVLLMDELRKLAPEPRQEPVGGGYDVVVR
jgi:hypothetical protein